jgi:hypothetical protein
MLRSVGLVRTDVSEELTATIIRLTRIGELGTTLAPAAEKLIFSETLVLQEPHGVTSQKTAFFKLFFIKYSEWSGVIRGL